MVQGVKVEHGHIVDVNPATGEVIGKIQMATHADVDAAVEAAKMAQQKWSAVSLSERKEMVRLAVRRIGLEPDALARLITQEMGKTLAEAKAEVADNSEMDEYCEVVGQANEAEKHGGAIIVRHPLGVVSVCAPWNFPIGEIVFLCIPALIAGNAVVVKPSEVAPLSGAKAVAAFQGGLNDNFPGLVNLVQGDGTVGSYLVGHPGVDMATMTGSSATGAKILKTASETMKRVVLECGGKDPMVVMADADVEKAAKDAVDWSLANCGQVCCAVERVYVASSIASSFEKAVVAHAASYKSVDGLAAASADTPAIGPMVSDVQRQAVHKQVQAALAAGARCVLGGHLPPSSQAGTFYPPTVLADVPHAAKAITQEETFGPVVALSTFDGTEKAAVALANDSTYGLTASVYSEDLASAGRIAAGIAAGQVGINNNPLFSGKNSIYSPFVGHKRSGYGSHSGRDGWRQFSTPKTLVYEASPPPAVLPTLAKPLPPSKEPLARPALVVGIVAAVAAVAVAVLTRRR